MLTERGAGDEEEAVFGEAGDGHIGFDAAAFVEALRVNNGVDRDIHLVGADVVEEFQRAGSAHFEFVEGGFVEETGVFAGHQVFVADGA